MPEVHPARADDDGPRHDVPAPQTPHGTKSFFRIGLEVVLISAGVFLGLLGEEWRENAEHRALATAALHRFRPEFPANKAEVERVHGRQEN